jgi:predicted lipoprotein
MDACADLGTFIEEELKPYFSENINDEATLDPIVKQYVDEVVLPTYEQLAQLNAALDNTVKTFKQNPSNANFAACAEAWLVAREPWESSEAFLFGPVDELGLDPNMDSWPLDQSKIAQILKSQDFTDLNWKEGDSEDKISKAQDVRGFHTLEYLIFKDGKARTVK